jgi:hypothetical protein
MDDGKGKGKQLDIPLTPVVVVDERPILDDEDP